METPDIASLLHDITPVNYRPNWLLWCIKWSTVGYVCMAVVFLCIAIACVYAVHYYYRNDVRALRALRHLERLCVPGASDTSILLDRLVAVIRKYLSDACGVESVAIAEDGLARSVRKLSLSADAQKHAERIFGMLVNYRFGQIHYSVQQVRELICSVRALVHAVRLSRS